MQGLMLEPMRLFSGPHVLHLGSPRHDWGYERSGGINCMPREEGPPGGDIQPIAPGALTLVALLCTSPASCPPHKHLLGLFQSSARDLSAVPTLGLKSLRGSLLKLPPTRGFLLPCSCLPHSCQHSSFFPGQLLLLSLEEKIRFSDWPDVKRDRPDL